MSKYAELRKCAETAMQDDANNVRLQYEELSNPKRILQLLDDLEAVKKESATLRDAYGAFWWLLTEWLLGDHSAGLPERTRIIMKEASKDITAVTVPNDL